jgi:hypothetical protein
MSGERTSPTASCRIVLSTWFSPVVLSRRIALNGEWVSSHAGAGIDWAIAKAARPLSSNFSCYDCMFLDSTTNEVPPVLTGDIHGSDERL